MPNRVLLDRDGLHVTCPPGPARYRSVIVAEVGVPSLDRYIVVTAEQAPQLVGALVAWLREGAPAV